MKLLFTLLCLLLWQSVLGETLEQQAGREVVVKLRAGPQRLDNADFPLSEKIVKVKQALPTSERAGELLKIVSLEMQTNADAQEMVRALRGSGMVEWAEVRQMRFNDARGEKRSARDALDAPPNDPYYSLQWYLDQIEAPAAWDLVEPDASIVLAVVDDGVNFALPDLQDARWENSSEVNGQAGVDDDNNGFVDDLYGYDFMDGDGDPVPFPLDGLNSHGTHITGIAAATRNNRIGIAGVAGGAKVMSVRVGQSGSIPYGYEGVYYACQNGARVINCSWGGGSESAYEREIVDYVRSQGCVVVVSAGNNGNSIPRYPAAIEGVLSVAATTAANTGAHFTSHGPWVKISAPGVHIFSTLADGTYSAWQGTSMAAPVVTAVCGMIFKKYPTWTSDQVITAICNSADPIDALNDTLPGQLGLGRVNAYRALSNHELPQGVRLASILFHETVGDGDNRIEAIEQAFLDIELANEHGELLGVSGTVVSLLDSIIVSPIELSYPAVLGHGVWLSANAEPRIRMPEVIDRGAVLPIAIDWRDGLGRIIGRATTTVLLDTTFATIETSALEFALGEQGALGYFDYVRNIPVGPGLALKSHLSNALYHGSIFIGDDNKVIDNYYGDPTGSRFDWTALDSVYARPQAVAPAPVAVSSRFDDRRLNDEDRVGAEVAATLLSWPEIPHGFGLDLTVVNRSEVDWIGGYCGMMMDWDLGPASRNFGGYDENSGILYVRSELVSLPMVGIAGLHEPLVTAFEISNRDEFHSGAFSDARVWEILTSGIGGFLAAPRDISHIAGLSLPDLSAGDSTERRFAIVTGNSINDMQATLNAIRFQLGLETASTSSELEASVKKPTVTPNPVKNGQALVIRGVTEGDATIALFNILGQQVATLKAQADAHGRLAFSPPSAVAPGLLLYRLEHAGGLSTGKLLYLP